RFAVCRQTDQLVRLDRRADRSRQGRCRRKDTRQRVLPVRIADRPALRRWRGYGHQCAVLARSALRLLDPKRRQLALDRIRTERRDGGHSGQNLPRQRLPRRHECRCAARGRHRKSLPDGSQSSFLGYLGGRCCVRPELPCRERQTVQWRGQSAPPHFRPVRHAASPARTLRMVAHRVGPQRVGSFAAGQTVRRVFSRSTGSGNPGDGLPTGAARREFPDAQRPRTGPVEHRVRARHEVNRERRDTMDPAIRRQTIADLLHRSAMRYPAKTGLECGDTRWTFAQFDAVCDRVAAGLSRLGVGKASRVAVLARNSHAFAALRFALARLGAVLVPINFMLKAEEVAYILKHAGAQMLATDSGLADTARAAAALGTAVKQFVCLPSEEPSQPVSGMTSFDALSRTDGTPPALDLAGTDLAQIVYTSGTESSPKGAMLTHD